MVIAPSIGTVGFPTCIYSATETYMMIKLYELFGQIVALTWATIAVVSLAGIEALHVVVQLLLTGLLEPDL